MATQLRSDRPPVRARSGRRPIPPLIFLLVLALAGAAVWWYVLRQDEERSVAQEQACQTAEAAAPSVDPASVSVRVFNATDQAGLAQTVAAQLQERGFTVAEIANDPTDREVTGIGEVRHGQRGHDQAAFLALHMAGATDHLDTRATAQVDFVLGPEFAALSSPEEVDAALAAGQSAAASC